MKLSEPAKIHTAYPIGMVVVVERPFLSSPDNSLAVVYEHYKVGNDHFGISLISELGCYDGFSEKCLEIFSVTPVRFEKSCSNYQFENVNKLIIDFDKGRFDKAFKKF
ncbi:hypothetical protein UA32_12505 [Photobacterium angustum]|uniref:Uncharacterized protein n=1 Tax=Photobacterium angustum TaxID=661 RepID=A0ABX5H1X1_PHOAN|nr:hypothetical protein [Photobacterium angustum]KJG37768.1 hypothetical protein UA32_12505 [Photobacterium angustum]PSX07035.1 hypothetical protein C0W27_15820 [Photobacterium angustum]